MADTYVRIQLEEIYKRSAELWALRSTCNRAQVGAVLVRDGRIVATGYNGAPKKSKHCIDPGVGCLIQVRDGRESCIRTLHCEQAMISFCSHHGIITKSAELWITLCPCYDCAKLVASAGISSVRYRDVYTGCNGLELLTELGVEVHPWD